MRVLGVISTALACFAACSEGLVQEPSSSHHLTSQKRELLQDVVTFDEKSLFIRGERIMVFSGEFHPFRLPVPDLWLDVLQKIKAMNFNAISIYTDWALLEGKAGDFRADGVFSIKAFLDAASQAGLYVLARPGPYINAEVSGGGFPGWLQRSTAHLRTRDPIYLNSTQNYVSQISQIFADAQITNGGPVILLQSENEYTSNDGSAIFPDPVYFEYVQQQYRKGGIEVPIISNDAYPAGNFATGPPRKEGAPDIYGHDGYPLGFDCANPEVWPDNYLPTTWRQSHLQQASSTPYSIVEMQGGSFDPWGGPGFAKCEVLLGPDFQRVFYVNDFSFGVTFFNIYMIFGGTNWGNLGHNGGYTSYDYGAAIAEDRTVAREKYSGLKLLANFLHASPAYIEAVPQNQGFAVSPGLSNNNAIATSISTTNTTNFIFVRHANYSSVDVTKYTLTLPTSKGNITVPQLGKNSGLTLPGRDARIFVTDYDVGGIHLLYSTAEIFTWKVYNGQRILLVYGVAGESELAIASSAVPHVLEGPAPQVRTKNGTVLINYTAGPQRTVVKLGNELTVFMLDRQSAYDYWYLPPSNLSSYGTSSNSNPIVRGAYLIRTVQATENAVHITGDLNATSPLEVIGAPEKATQLTFNGNPIKFSKTRSNTLVGQLQYTAPQVNIPDLTQAHWQVLESLPEISKGYDDSAWPKASLTHSNNRETNLSTPTSLFASDYGFNAGTLVYRGHFTANGNESTFSITTQGAYAYGHSIWLDSTFIGSFYGADKYYSWNDTYQLPHGLKRGSQHVLTVVIDNTGLDENGPGGNEMQTPRGILDYTLTGHPQSAITWKLTGNLRGEDYPDKSRGPLNEGGMYAERNGYHLPGAPSSGPGWSSSAHGPLTGISKAGIAFYTTTFDLKIPSGYDIPLSLSLTNTTAAAHITSYRAQLFVNGWQFGKYIHNIGPQTEFPVPPGIWNTNGKNYLGITLWALETKGAKLDGLQLVAGPAIQTSLGPVKAAPGDGWVRRKDAY